MLTYFFQALFNFKKIFCFLFHTNNTSTLSGEYCEKCERIIYSGEELIYTVLVVLAALLIIVTLYTL